MTCSKCSHYPRLDWAHCHCDCHICKTCQHHESGHNEDGVCRIDNTHFDDYDEEHPYDCRCVELRL